MHRLSLKSFFNYKVHRADHASGLKINFFSLFSITFTVFGFAGKRYMDKKGFFNIDISFQITPMIWRKCFFPKVEELTKNWVSLCRNCGPMVKHIAEHWAKGQSGPYMIEFIDYDDSSNPRLIDRITLGEKPTGKSLKYLACMNCNNVVVKMPPKQIEKMIEERAMKKYDN